MRHYTVYRFLITAVLIIVVAFLIYFVYRQYHVDNHQFQQGNVIWQSCHQDRFRAWFYDDIDKNLQCTTIDVPLDPFDKANQQTVQLAFTRLPAKKPSNQDLLYIQGGPGFHGLSTPMDLVQNNQKLHQDFNIIGYAPRGIYPSTPYIFCDYAINKTGKEIAEGCFKHTPQMLLDKIGTNYAVEDIEFIRNLLGINKLNVFGVSYGTKVLNYYTQKYGQNLRAGIFDGVVDTTLNPVDDFIAMSQSFQNSFERFAQACLDGEFSDDCLFNKDEDVNEQFHRLLNRLEQKNLTDDEGEKIDGDSLIYILMEGLYAKEIWDYLHTVFVFVENDDVEMYNLFKSYVKNSNYESSGLVAINCADYASKSRHDKKAYLESMKKVDAADIFDNYRKRTEDDYLDACFYWKNDGADTFEMPVAAKNTPPLLFVSFVHDPATPHRQALKMAQAFGSPVITRQGDGHGAVFSNSACVDDIVLGYLNNPTKSIDTQTCE